MNCLTILATCMEPASIYLCVSSGGLEAKLDILIYMRSNECKVKGNKHRPQDRPLWYPTNY